MYNSNPRKIKLQAVFVGHVIDSTTFLVSRQRKVNPPPNLREVLSLESQLWDMRYELAVPSVWKMSKGQLVSVICGEKLIKRGRISEIHSDLNLVNVLLVDTGEVLKDIDVESRIRELPVSFVRTPVLAYKLNLKALEKTNEASEEMVRSLVACADRTWVKSSKGNPLLDLVLYFEECSPINTPRALIEYEYLIRDNNCVSIREVLSEFRSPIIEDTHTPYLGESPLKPRPFNERSGMTSDYFSLDFEGEGKLPNQSSICGGLETDEMVTDEANFIPDDISAIEVRQGDNYHSIIQTSFARSVIDNCLTIEGQSSI